MLIMKSRLNKDKSYHAQQRKIKKATIYCLRKTNETNSFREKTLRGFYLFILKVKQIYYRESKFLQSDLTLNLLLPPVVTY